MARISASTINGWFTFFALAVAGLLGWNIGLQVQVTRIANSNPDTFNYTTVGLKSFLYIGSSQNLTYVVGSSEVDINDPQFFIVVSCAIETYQNGAEKFFLYSFFTFPFNGTASGQPIYIDVEIPTEFLGPTDLAFSSPVYTGAFGSVDPNYVPVNAYHPQDITGYPPNWMRFTVIPLSGAANQAYVSSSFQVLAGGFI